jgi:hypothetical protein
MLGKKPKIIGAISAGVASLLIFGFAGWLLLNRQYVADQVSVWAYQAPADIKAIEDRIDFTGKGQFYFYTAQPEIAPADNFNEGCPRQESGSPILGCYTAEKRIFIYDITNPQLDGIEEVTAAHEMLHAAWDRMSDWERRDLGKLLRAEYSQIVNPELKERMDYYARTQPGEFENELHSIIGTEFPSISNELEQHYKMYFDDRARVVALHDKYNHVFTSLADETDTLFEELTTLGTSIQTRVAQYNRDIDQLSDDIDDFNYRADNGDFVSMAQFYNERAALTARSSQLEADRVAVNADIQTYNQKYDRYQELAAQIEVLNESLDSFSNLTAAPLL